ncbi:hypothetical protein LSAT2_026096 [Lamellibrachia satsuma]|nr:hypothetical protein LSAT2_026096 [Lamellibrachia satsuma]
MRAPVFILLSLVLTLSLTCEATIGKYACNYKPYNVYTHFCCSNTLYEKTGFNTCCVDQVIDTRNSLCWMGFSVVSFLKDCGEKKYHNQYESCCGGEVMETWSGTQECRKGKIVERE